MKKISKPTSNEYALYYEQLISLVNDEISVLDQLKMNAKLIEQQILTITDEQLSYSSAPDKWTIKDIIMHLTDLERVFLYRALRFARNDKMPLLFFDENEFAKQAKAVDMPIKKILKEYKTSRQASIAFFANQPVAILKRTGMASNTTTSVRACAWIICGHEIHHWNVIREKYLFEEGR